MTRVCFTLQVRPDRLDEYRQQHTTVWPAMLRALRDAGWRDYQLFLREDGLLSIARSGVVYTPGGAGTEQEIFTDTAQNSLTLYSVRSPMVFLGRRFFEEAHAELVAAARKQATTFGWEDLIYSCDDPAEAVAFISAHDPDTAGAARVEPRRTHADT